MTPEALRDLYERRAHALVRRPALARGTGQARVIARDGLACEVQHAHAPLRVDLPVHEGGENSAPHPGELMRASIGACLVTGYRVWAARLGVPIDAVTLEITCDFDARGRLGVTASVPCGWLRVVVDVTFTSAADEADVARVVDASHHHSPMLSNLSPSVERIYRVTVVRPPA
jgi:uncharacterized OsmC-like protein